MTKTPVFHVSQYSFETYYPVKGMQPTILLSGLKEEYYTLVAW